MHVLSVLNVCEAFDAGIRYLRRIGNISSSRAGKVIVAPGPVVTVYHNPTQRVLFCAQRDANPFFHLMEALWMLAGRNDVAFLNRFIKSFGERYGDGDFVHDAYGYRWRQSLGFDQLDQIVKMLRKDPTSRQAVLQMWDAGGQDDLKGSWKTRPCNTHAYFLIQGGELDMTVCCRSNDIIWGAYGANAVHFSILQEYLAAAIGVPVGIYYQVSNNYHAYLTEYEKYEDDTNLYDNRYRNLVPARLVDDPESFLEEVAAVLEGKTEAFHNSFLEHTVVPMLRMHQTRIKEPVAAPDWEVAAHEWLDRRKK